MTVSFLRSVCHLVSQGQLKASYCNQELENYQSVLPEKKMSHFPYSQDLSPGDFHLFWPSQRITAWNKSS